MPRLFVLVQALSIPLVLVVTTPAPADRIDLITNFTLGGKLSGDGYIFSVIPSCGPSADCAFESVLLDLRTNEIAGVSGDGATFAGDVITSAGSRVFVLHGNDVQFLETPEDSLWSHALGLSADGTNVLGFHHQVDDEGRGIRNGFVWNAVEGMTNLGDFIPESSSFDGRIIIGNGSPKGSLRQAVMWDPTNGVRFIEEVFAAQIESLPISNLRLSEAIDISHDGKTIVGTGYAEFDAEVAWIIRFGEFEACDLNADSVCDALDIDGIRTGQGWPNRPNTAYDLNVDHLIDQADRLSWLDMMDVSPGDANLDGKVQMDDFLALAANFGQAGGWAAGDFDGDGFVTFPDFLRLASEFGGSRTQAVPEPDLVHSLALALAATLLVSRFRRRRLH